jgi:hypothetical protein
MKTQINQLYSGLKNQILNPATDYSHLTKSTSHNNHAGVNADLVQDVWNKVTYENPEYLNITIKGIALNLKANWSLSRKSCNYYCSLTVDQMIKLAGLAPAMGKTPSISVCGNIVEIRNGKKSYVYICPSFIKINE